MKYLKNIVIYIVIIPFYIFANQSSTNLVLSEAESLFRDIEYHFNSRMLTYQGIDKEEKFQEFINELRKLNQLSKDLFGQELSNKIIQSIREYLLQCYSYPESFSFQYETHFERIAQRLEDSKRISSYHRFFYEYIKVNSSAYDDDDSNESSRILNELSVVIRYLAAYLYTNGNISFKDFIKKEYSSRGATYYYISGLINADNQKNRRQLTRNSKARLSKYSRIHEFVDLENIALFREQDQNELPSL